MSVGLSSRYANSTVFTAADSDGEEHPTVAIRRTEEQVTAGADSYQHVVIAGESLEYLAWRYFNNSAAWWRLADQRALVFPLDLPSGVQVAVPAPADVGRVVRTRRF
jgi:hypothetical protein